MPESAGSRGDAQSLPINVLLKGRSCLLVGAGHVAHRKCLSLLDHGAAVTLVAPEAYPRIRDLEAQGLVEVRIGRYDPTLLSELRPFLVYAATDDDGLNRSITADARRLGILCSSVSSWREGDFISPSRIPWGKGQVSVSTEGASCRQAKFMRLRLQELLGGERELLVMGVDLRSLSLEEFERIRPEAERIGELTDQLRQLAALEEFVLLSTCNRLEVYAWTRAGEGLLKTVRLILGLEAVSEKLYTKTGDEVLEHAAKVVSGSLSQVISETQITGQFKAAFKSAFAANVAGVHMQRLFDRVLKLGRRIRSLAGAGEDGLPELVAQVVRGRSQGKPSRVLVLGAGGLGCEVAARVVQVSGVELAWANRTLARIPDDPDCRRLDLADALRELGSRFDVVVSVLGAPASVILPEHLGDTEDPPLFLDLGLPRNVHPSISEGGLAEVLDLGHFRNPGVNRERLLAIAHTVTNG